MESWVQKCTRRQTLMPQQLWTALTVPAQFTQQPSADMTGIKNRIRVALTAVTHHKLANAFVYIGPLVKHFHLLFKRKVNSSLNACAAMILRNVPHMHYSIAAITYCFLDFHKSVRIATCNYSLFYTYLSPFSFL